MTKPLKIGLFFGGFGPNSLFGTDRRDLMFGGFGADTIDAGAGDDIVFGGFGDDTVLGGAGSDTIYGGFGTDTAVYEGGVDDYDWDIKPARGASPVQVTIADLNGDTDRLNGVERLYFAADDYTADLTGPNNAVLARDDAAMATADAPTLLAGLTANDFDFDGDTLRITAIDTTSLIGSASLNGDGTISYDAQGAFDSLKDGETATTTLSYTVTDGRGSFDTATVTITVTGVNDAPALALSDTAISENSVAVLTAAATDADGDALTYTISGDDAALFVIDPATGVLAFATGPDFEAPADADGDNIYAVSVIATDAGGLSATSDINVTVTDVDETTVFLNEIHYDNSGSDVGEFIELAGVAGTDLTGWSLVLYNGSNGEVYETVTLSGNLSGTEGQGYVAVSIAGIQNGAPDGFALINATDQVVEFLSYEGTLTAIEGPAAGLTSSDIGVAESSGTPEGYSLARQADGTWAAPAPATPDADNVTPPAPQIASFINEIHYDDAGADEGEFIEIAGPAGGDLTGWTLVAYNGNGGSAYDTVVLTGTLSGTTGEGYLVVDIAGLQNGAPDGVALVDGNGAVVEFLSYEGSFTATDGPAAGVISDDIGVSETGSETEGLSLQRLDDGTWAGPIAETRGTDNTPNIATQINEIHYDNIGTDAGEFIEIAGAAGTDLTGWSLQFYNGNDGNTYATIALNGVLSGTTGQGYLSVDGPSGGIQNGAPDGVALVDDTGTVVEFLSYEGTMVAANGFAAGLTSTDIGVVEGSDTSVGFSVQRQDDGTWAAPAASTRDAANGADAPPPPPPEPGETTLISTIQGNGFESALVGQTVTVEAIVTKVEANGFYLQEQDADADGDAATSEGIFVFTGDTPNVTVSYAATVTGIVGENFGFTQITAQTFQMVGALAALPTAAALSLPIAADAVLESVEGMLVTLDIGTADAPLQVIETFELGRFGEIVVSEGPQFQPTQLYDAQTEAIEIAVLQAANAANRLTIDDGNSAQNPTSFGYIPNTTAGDNGDGILGANDDLSQGGTLRIGAQITAPVTGVMTYNFSEYKLVTTEVLQIDPATNTDAREPAPADLGGTLQVASVNALNYFTTLAQDDSNARGALTPEDFVRQTDKLVNAITALDADIIGLQEIENNGFGDGSAIATLVEALNTRAGGEVYAFVDPTGTGSTIGTDAITTGLIYRIDAVDVVGSGIYEYDDGGTQRNRPTVAALFEDANGEQITIAVNHFKSKGGSGTGGDADIGDGQGNFNETRTNAANQLTEWLASDPFGTGDPDFLIIGDLNAYGKEDPVQAIEDAGYTSLLSSLIGEDAFSYTFDGQRGALDQALASASLELQVTGITEWHINSLEPSLLGYSTQFTDAGWYNGSDPYSASDHDPLLIGLDLRTVNELNA